MHRVSHLPPAAAAASSAAITNTTTRPRFFLVSAAAPPAAPLRNHFPSNSPPTSLLSPSLKWLFQPWAAAHPLRFSREPVSFSTGISSGCNREILVQHLLVKEDNPKLLLELQQKISDGEDLSDLAVEYSVCSSKGSGGMLGWVRKGEMVPEFEEAAFSAPLNKVVKCKSKFGWHLLQVLSEREESLFNVGPGELHAKFQDSNFKEDAQLIDVREHDEVKKASLPAFKVLPLSEFGSWGPEITTKFSTEKDIYVLCHHGMRSLQIARWLQTQGFKRVFNVSGGIHAYAVEADSSISTY